MWENVHHVHRRTLALFARGREIGFAVFDRAELLRFGVRSVRGSRRGARFERRVAGALEALTRVADSDRRLVVETGASPSAKKGSLHRALRRLVRTTDAQTHGVSLSDAKRLLCGSASATQADLIAAVAERHPVCRLPESPKRVGVKPYGIVGVLAVALADTLFAIEKAR